MDKDGQDVMKGTWADSLLESVLKALLSYSRTSRADLDFGVSSVINAGKDHVRTFELMKKNFKVRTDFPLLSINITLMVPLN